MAEMVIAVYRPKPGKEAELMELAREHVPFLRRLGLASDRPCLAMRAKDGAIVEVFEWRDGAVEKAHSHPEVQAMWARYGEVCEYSPIADLAEAKHPFSDFEPLDF
ncbi:MAG TPA: hypothetical protein VGS12_14785 [Caulobacteraceae bacterium]|nr:hypothetical protein [Caulobacteraceae bacterium]